MGNAEEGEEAQEAQSHNENELKQESVLQSLGLVEKALAKINAGAYGMCEVNDKPHTIKKERLMAFPEAPTCLEHSPKQ